MVRRRVFTLTRFAAACGSVIAVMSGCSNGSVDLIGFEVDAAVDSTSPDVVVSADTQSADASPQFGEAATNTSFEVNPTALQTIDVPLGQTMPTLHYTATSSTGVPISVTWSVDRGDVGSIQSSPSNTCTFVPTGTTGGTVNVVATLGKNVIMRPILVRLAGQQNGATTSTEASQLAGTVAQLKSGGGIGGVGGEGLGGPVADASILAALKTPTSNGKTQKLALLYPYDKTVWPRGMLAPLLMWTWATNDADAVQIQLSTTSGSFSWTGTFGRPAILTQTGGAFIRHPIPQDVWDMATNTAGGVINHVRDQLTVSLTIAKGGQAYGPISETWSIAPTRLTGTVYYNAYATALAQNWISDAAGHRVGGAVLSIRSGDTGPQLAAGFTSPDESGCRACHVVASRGNTLVTQSHPSESQSYLFDLSTPNVQASQVAIPQAGIFTWAALTSDGSYALTNAVSPSSTNGGIPNALDGTATSSFWQFGQSPQPAILKGLPAGVAAGYPSFSPDDKHLAYIDVTGSTQDVHGPMVMADYDSSAHALSGMTTLLSPKAGQRIGFPVFLPDDSGIVFETQVRTGGKAIGTPGDSVLVTRSGARSELWWVNASGSPQPTALAQVNGKGYLPIGPNNHGIAGAIDKEDSYDETGWDDTTLDYEPTVLPVAAGGYAWVVLTTRRLYGNQLTAVPWQSNAPEYDTTDLKQATVKKLWVAAIDLNAPAGSDPSHPAFYLPAQEILAGNSRGFWVLDPCKQAGQGCESGDQCCDGFCEAKGSGALVCSGQQSGCAGLSDKCATAADCCDATNLCVNGFCAQQPEQ